MVKQLLELYSSNSSTWEKYGPLYGPLIEKEGFTLVHDLLGDCFINEYTKHEGFHDYLLSKIHIKSNKSTSVKLYFKELDNHEELTLLFNKCTRFKETLNNDSNILNSVFEQNFRSYRSDLPAQSSLFLP